MSSIPNIRRVGITTSSREATVKADILRAKRAWRERSHGRDGIYDYLQVVFDIGKRWKRDGAGIKNSKIVRRNCNHPNEPKSGMTRFPVIIWATATLPASDNGKTRSKYSRLLQLAEEWGEESIKEFVLEYGGINEYLAQLK
jgi:hypothetical protein